MVNRLERLLADPSQSDAMRRFGRTRALQMFNNERFSGEVH
jgi:hypothetical protein